MKTTIRFEVAPVEGVHPVQSPDGGWHDREVEPDDEGRIRQPSGDELSSQQYRLRAGRARAPNAEARPLNSKLAGGYGERNIMTLVENILGIRLLSPGQKIFRVLGS